jgi:N-formylglutamate deformylase
VSPAHDHLHSHKRTIVGEAVKVLGPRTSARPLVASVPHGSTVIPERFASLLTVDPDRLWVDAFTPELYSFLGDLGAVTVQAGLSRFVADPNRDPGYTLFGPFWSAIIPSSTPLGKAIYSTEPSREELAERVAMAHTAYHQAIDQAIERLGQRYRSLLLLDLHSFGHASDEFDADVILGDGRGTTATPSVVDLVEASISDQGFSVVRNVVFSGGWIVRRFADAAHVDAVQIELNQRCYIDRGDIDADRFPRSFDPQRVDAVPHRLRRAISRGSSSPTRVTLTERGSPWGHLH